MMQLRAAADGEQQCALGHHAWVPWLELYMKYVTWCVRCGHKEEYQL